LKQLETETIRIRDLLTSTLPHIPFNNKNIDNAQKAFKIEIKALQTQIKKRHIRSERYKLLGQLQQMTELNTQAAALRDKMTLLYRRELEILFLRFSSDLQIKENKVFSLHKQMLDIVKNRLNGSDRLKEQLDQLLKTMEKKQLGTVAAIKGMDAQSIQYNIKEFWELANEPLFYINKTPISVAKLLFALLIFTIGLLLGGLFRSNIKKLSLRNRALTSSTRTMIANIGYYLIIIVTFFVIIQVLGINLTSLALVAGALSVGIGFGLQNVISNFVSGIILMVERSIKIGDYIQLDDKLRGHVVDIKMRSITINTNANIDIIVPNQDLIQNRVINWTMNDKIRRFEIPFGVAYGTDAQRVIDIVEDAVKKSGFKDIHTEPERHTQVIMTGMGNSSVDFKLFVWIRGVTIFYPQRTASRFLIVIYNALYEAGIEIPFPQQDLHIRSIDTELPVVVRHEGEAQ
jgi:small-conductance mechanosensitive channel